MKRFAIVGVLVLTACFAGGAAPGAVSDDPGRPRDTDETPAGEPGIKFQEFEDPVERLKPAKPRGPGDEARLDALAWFGSARFTGKLRLAST